MLFRLDFKDLDLRDIDLKGKIKLLKEDIVVVIAVIWRNFST